jgi:hypothetical protein
MDGREHEKQVFAFQIHVTGKIISMYSHCCFWIDFADQNLDKVCKHVFSIEISKHIFDRKCKTIFWRKSGKRHNDRNGVTENATQQPTRQEHFVTLNVLLISSYFPEFDFRVFVYHLTCRQVRMRERLPRPLLVV